MYGWIIWSSKWVDGSLDSGIHRYMKACMNVCGHSIGRWVCVTDEWMNEWIDRWMEN